MSIKFNPKKGSWGEKFECGLLQQRVKVSFKHINEVRRHIIVVIMEEIRLKPIGVAKNCENRSRFGSFEDVVSEIVVDEEFTDALNGIDDYSHVIIVYWMDKINNYVITHRPQGNPEVPIIGIFSCRCPQRPNPIGVTTVKLIERTRNRIKVRGLDILDGTPIIDIKPYWPVYDDVEDGRIPNWVNKLDI